MSDYGTKGSVPGYDVRSVTDYLLQFSSSWPHLKIEHGAASSITMNSTPQTIYTHNLGYSAFYFIISGGQFDAVGGINRGIGINSTDLAYDGSQPIGGTYSFYFYICRLPLTQDFTAPQITGSTVAATENHDYGFKVAKPGKSIDSTDMRDFSLHSSTRSLMIHQVETADMSVSGGFYVRTTTHGLGYIPHGFAYIKPGANTAGLSTSRYYLMPHGIGAQTANYSITTTTLAMRADNSILTGTPTSTAVVLKDPFSKETVNVSFP